MGSLLTVALLLCSAGILLYTDPTNPWSYWIMGTSVGIVGGWIYRDDYLEGMEDNDY